MAELKDQLRADLTTAMKSQDKLRTATLRMLLAPRHRRPAPADDVFVEVLAAAHP